MPLQGSGEISLGNVQGYFGGSNPVSMSEYYANGVNRLSPLPGGGQISMSNFYGTKWHTYIQLSTGSRSFTVPAGSYNLYCITVGGGAGGGWKQDTNDGARNNAKHGGSGGVSWGTIWISSGGATTVTAYVGGGGGGDNDETGHPGGSSYININGTNYLVSGGGSAGPVNGSGNMGRNYAGCYANIRNSLGYFTENSTFNNLEYWANQQSVENNSSISVSAKAYEPQGPALHRPGGGGLYKLNATGYGGVNGFVAVFY